MMQTYTHYKDSGIDWIGEIPEHWEVKPGFTVLKERKEKNKGMISNNVLSLSYGKIIEKPVEKLTGLVPENFETYQLVYKGDIIFRPTDLQNDKVSLRTGLSKFNGIITSAYINLQPINSEPKFLHYYLHTTDTNKVIYGLGSGLRQNISFLDFKRFGFVVPPIHEQEAIANFLDDKTAKIDALVQTKAQQIEKLKELRQVKIHQVVTKGLDASTPTKDSGVEWVGEIPAHWEVKKVKHLAYIKSGEAIINSQLKDIGKYEVFGGNGLMGYYDKYNVNGKNLIIGRVGALCGNVRYIEDKKWISDNALILKLINEKYYRFIYISLIAGDLNKLNTSNAQPLITGTKVLNFSISFPPIQEQEQIVVYLDEVTGKIDQAIAQKQEQISKLKEYKQSLINEVVTGKVKVC